MSGNMNENTFVGLTYHELSQEGFGLPSIRNLRAPSEKELFNSPIVKAAAAKAKAYGSKKGYTSFKPTNDYEKMSLIKSIIRKRKLTATKEELKIITNNIDLFSIDGIYIVKCKSLIKPSQKVLLGFIACAVGAVVGFNIGNIIYNLTSGQKAVTSSLSQSDKLIHASNNATMKGLSLSTKGIDPSFTFNMSEQLLDLSNKALKSAMDADAELSKSTRNNTIIGIAVSLIGTLFYKFLEKHFIKKNVQKELSIFISWVIFKDYAGKIVLKQFCNGIIDPKMYVPSKEDLIVSNETDEVSMTDLVENETTVEEDAGKDSEVTNVNIPQDDSAHNEEASSGGVVTSDNKDDLEVKPTETDTNSTEAWYDDPAYSLEETGEDGVCMQCLVDNETTVEEDAGKDSEVKDSKPTEAETEHNEEASAGGVLTGDNKDNLEVKETSEEVLGITDYDLYSEDEYKSLEGVFDPDDLK